jgi:Protein of unknown function (DUF3788)
MVERVFFDESTKPSEKSLRAALGDFYNNFKDLMDISDSFSKDWNFSKRSGWMLKVHDKKKALFYVIPMKNEFIVSMAIRDNERIMYINDLELKKIHDKLLTAKKYKEGFLLRFKTDDDDYETFELLIRKLIPCRQG